MRIRKYLGEAAIVTTVIMSLALLGAAPALADNGAGDVLGTVTSATPETANNAAAVATTDSGENAIDAQVSGADVTVPIDPVSGITLGTAAGVLSVGLPYAGGASNVNVEKDGVVSYDNNNGSSSVPVVTTDGSIQINTVITAAIAPKRYDYALTVPDGGQILQAGEAYFVVNGDGATLAYIAAPWAKDANGVAVPTHYELNGNTLTQVVDFTATTAFPVVADPSVTWLWWGRTAKFTKAETKQAADFASAGQMFSYLCIIGGLAGAACTTVANLGFQIVKNAATNALKAGRCIQLNIPYVGPGLIYDVKC
ncbi:hypothetical protein [Leifsonia aquatica]|uniref:hypothetical protein n=1 Tax=Leifsonia aquatica TaxID=144185 RepID=UPI0004694496|nr:hypothetical protein [Leifsonia aquatica]